MNTRELPRRPVSRAAGATLIEFTLVLLLGALPMVLAIVQVAALLIAHNTVNLATFLAARQGALTNADPGAMRRELARGLLPLYVPAARDGRVAANVALRAYATALGEVMLFDELRIESPTRRQAARLVQVRAGVPVIPNDALEFRGPLAQDANVLGIAVTHCHPLVVPLVGSALAQLLSALDGDALHQRCYALGRAPLRAHAAVAMQSDTLLAALPP
jgi:hypothetical protein